MIPFPMTLCITILKYYQTIFIMLWLDINRYLNLNLKIGINN